MSAMGVRRVSELLSLPVRHNGIDLGHPVDVLLNLDTGRALGLEVRCRDDVNRFIPLGAARLASDATELASPLALLDDVAFYRARGAAVRALRGAAVTGHGAAGPLADVLLADSGAIDSLLVETRSGPTRLRFEPGVTNVTVRSASAA